MKNNKTLIYTFILSCICLVSCNNNISTSISNSVNDSSTTQVENEKYTIAFFNNNSLVYMEETTPGEFVNIPDESMLANDPRYSDPRYSFAGWEGIDEIDFAAGKVEVFHQDAFYNAIWYEHFGTENKFEITKVFSTDSIVVDGLLDDAYLKTKAILANTVTQGETSTTATLYFMFDEEYLYFFADVKDSTVFTRDYEYDGEQWVEHNDAVEFWIDLLHNDSKIAPNWNGGWGGSYRGEPGPMCEAHFKINAGYDSEVHGRYNKGSEAIWDGWWSNACNTDEVSFGTSKVNDEGYTVEYRISLKDEHIPTDLKLNENQEIGIGVKIYDKKESGGNKNSPAANVVTLEYINNDMSGPKKLSNFVVKYNEK